MFVSALWLRLDKKSAAPARLETRASVQLFLLLVELWALRSEICLHKKEGEETHQTKKGASASRPKHQSAVCNFIDQNKLLPCINSFKTMPVTLKTAQSTKKWTWTIFWYFSKYKRRCIGATHSSFVHCVRHTTLDGLLHRWYRWERRACKWYSRSCKTDRKEIWANVSNVFAKLELPFLVRPYWISFNFHSSSRQCSNSTADKLTEEHVRLSWTINYKLMFGFQQPPAIWLFQPFFPWIL